MNLILVIGHTGQGKTPWVSNRMRNGYKPNPVNTDKSLQVITGNSLRQYVFDVNNEYVFPTDEIMRPQMRHTQSDVKKFLEVSKKLKNTNIIFEDATGFFRGKQSADLMRQIVGKMHTGNNFIILFHSINRVPPELMEMANLLVLFRTVDNIDIVDKKFKNATLTAAFLELKKNKSLKHLSIKLM